MLETPAQHCTSSEKRSLEQWIDFLYLSGKEYAHREGLPFDDLRKASQWRSFEAFGGVFTFPGMET